MSKYLGGVLHLDRLDIFYDSDEGVYDIKDPTELLNISKEIVKKLNNNETIKPVIIDKINLTDLNTSIISCIPIIEYDKTDLYLCINDGNYYSLRIVIAGSDMSINEVVLTEL